MRWTLVNYMNERYYGLNEMNEMNYGLKEIKMKCDQWSRWCDRRKELRSSDCFIKYCNISYEKMVATAFWFYLVWYKTFSYGVQSCLLLLFKKYFAIFIKRNSRFTKLFSKPASLTLSNYSKLIYPLMHQTNIIPMILKGYH